MTSRAVSTSGNDGGLAVLGVGPDGFAHHTSQAFRPGELFLICYLFGSDVGIHFQLPKGPLQCTPFNPPYAS